MGKLFLVQLRNFLVYASTLVRANSKHITITITLTMMVLGFMMTTLKVDAQDSLNVALKHWQSALSSNLNLAQLALANWTGGGQSALSLNTQQVAQLNFRRGRIRWNNTMEVAYGLQKINGGGLRKSDDQLKLVSELNYTFRNERWQWTTRLNFWSQFAPGFIYGETKDENVEISRFMAPGYFQQALGLSYTQNSNLTVSILPLTGKVTVVISDMLGPRYGLAPGQHVKTELGASFNFAVDHMIIENVQLLTDLNLFAPYEALSRIDVNGGLQIKMRVNKYISTSITAQLIYDHDVDIDREVEGIQRDIQFKELLTVGFVYDWGSSKNSSDP